MAYELGEGVKRDVVEAARWYEQAAAQDFVDSQLNLARLHTNGDGLPVNQDEAARWFSRAAKLGDPEAQFRVSLAYAGGLGHRPNLVKAYVWCERSAAGGFEQARQFREELTRRMTAEQLAEAGQLATEE